MPNSSKITMDKLNQILNAWEQMAADKSFGGMTLTQFRAVVARCTAARDRLADLADQTVQATTERENADEMVSVRPNSQSTAFAPILVKAKTAPSTQVWVTSGPATASPASTARKAVRVAAARLRHNQRRFSSQSDG